MDEGQSILSVLARKAAQKGDWNTVSNCAIDILKLDNRSPEGHFLTGLVEKASHQPVKATQSFSTALQLSADRYDAAIELANQYCIARRNGDAAALLAKYEDKLGNSPLYLDLAGTVYSDIGMPEKAWPLYLKANELQPGIDIFQANLASCAVYLGKIEEAKRTYQQLLRKYPGHQRNHYYLARLEKAVDASHVEQMKEILRTSNLSPDKNIFLYYAIGKELEDLQEWSEAFRYYKLAGDAVASVADYDVKTDLDIIEKLIEICSADWLSEEPAIAESGPAEKTPIFIVGLPRTGTTLTERIVGSHSQVASLGETEFIQMVIRRESGIPGIEKMTPRMIEAVAKKDIRLISKGYLDAVSYRLGEEPLFIDKLPFNFLYLGFIAKAFPGARMVYVNRNPMDACFAMYKQVFTWAYKFSYTLDGLARYYVAYEKLREHWRSILGDRLIELTYESLVSDQEGETRRLLDRLGLEFEEACLNFDQSRTASTTASSVQVRQKIHSRSVDRWKHFSKQLQPLRDQLTTAGIAVD